MVHPYIALKGELHILSTIFAWVMAWANIIAPMVKLLITIYIWCCLWQRANYLCSTKCSVHSWHRMPSMSDTFLAVFWQPIVNHCCRTCWATYCPKFQCQHRMMIQKVQRRLWLLRKSLINKLLNHPYCISCALICTENALTSDKIRHLWHRSTLVELLATRTCSVLLLLL